MIEIKIDGIQAECKFDFADGKILGDDIRRALISLYRVGGFRTQGRRGVVADLGRRPRLPGVGRGTHGGALRWQGNLILRS